MKKTIDQWEKEAAVLRRWLRRVNPFHPAWDKRLRTYNNIMTTIWTKTHKAVRSNYEYDVSVMK